MKRSLIGLAVALCATGAHAYTDAVMAQPEGLSVFDRAYEAKRAGKQVSASFHESKPIAGAVIDLSADNPVLSVEETETERRYRQILADLEQNRVRLNAARVEAERKVETAQAEVKAKAEARVQVLEKQRTSIEQQLLVVQQQMEAVRAQEQAVKAALAHNDAAIQDVAKLEKEGDLEVARIKQESQQILMLAESSAVAIESAAKNRLVLEQIDPTVVMNERIKAEFQGATMYEIARSIMPESWRVQVNFHTRPELAERRYEFISTDPRDLALRKLTGSVRDAKVTFAYFWDLTDAGGNPEPLLLITDRTK